MSDELHDLDDVAAELGVDLSPTIRERIAKWDEVGGLATGEAALASGWSVLPIKAGEEEGGEK